MKGKTKKLACYMLVLSLLITSITTAYINKPTPVKGGEIVLTYTAYEVMLAIMAGLGLSVADYGIQTSQDDLENAKAFYESCQHWEEVDKEYLNKAIETAQTTGQVVIDKASGVWEKLKAQFGEVIDKFKTPDIDESEYESYYNMGNFDSGTPYYTNFYTYLDWVVFNSYNKYGIQTSGHFSDYDTGNFHSISSPYYYTIFTTLQSNGSYVVHGCCASSVDGMMKEIKQIRTDLVSPTSSSYHTFSVWNFSPNPVDGQWKAGASSSYNSTMTGQCVDLQILSPSGYENYLELKGLGMTNVSYKDNYDIVYHPPTVGDVAHAYDIITPENTAEKDEDGTYKIGGAYVIDVANPVTYPVDLTDGQTIPDEKSEIGTIPITDIVKVNEKTDTGEDNKTEETENTGGSTKPIVPDVSSGDIPDMAVLKTLFPFCIPFDIADSIKLMQADAVAPKWTIKINIPIGKKTIPFEFTIDMSILDEQVKIFRDGQVVIFIIGLAFATTKVIKWGASEE